jgi:predicted dithiol-disulfide oxidoreductase (DUF899 family)
MVDTILVPAADVAAKNKAQFPNESPEYRQARNALLAEEIELRRNIERVAAIRRALPSGGEIPEDYTFEGHGGAVRISQLFGDKDTLVIYSMMFGPATRASMSYVYRHADLMGRHRQKPVRACRHRRYRTLADRPPP